MEVTGIGPSEVALIVRAVGATRYGHHIEIRTSTDISPRRCGYTRRARAGPGARSSARWSSPATGRIGPRRVTAACWHVHDDVLSVWFERFLHARVGTRHASYTAGTQAHDGTAWRAGDALYAAEEVPLWTPTSRN